MTELYKHTFTYNIIDTENEDNNELNKKIEIYHEDSKLSIKEVEELILSTMWRRLKIENIEVVSPSIMVLIDIPRVSINYN